MGVCVLLLFNGASTAKGHQRLDFVEESLDVDNLRSCLGPLKSQKVSSLSPEMTSSATSGRLQIALTVPLPPPTSPSQNYHFEKSRKLLELVSSQFCATRMIDCSLDATIIFRCVCMYVHTTQCRGGHFCQTLGMWINAVCGHVFTNNNN